MSQAGIISTSSGPSPPSVPTQFTTDSGVAVPVANNLNIFGIDSTANNTNGVATSGSGSTVDVILTNRIRGAGTTTDGTTTVVLFTFPLGAIAGTYIFSTQIVVYDITDSLGAGYVSNTCVRTTGVAATKVGSSLSMEAEEGALSGISATAVTNVVANTFSIEVIGLAGKTIDYYAITTYNFVS